MKSTVTGRLATRTDAAAIARIYTQGIEERVATFETEPRTEEDVIGWLVRGMPVVVVEDDDGRVVAWASAGQYRTRECYAGIGDFSVYVAREHRGNGYGRVAMEALIGECERRGYWKLVSRVFPENRASLRLLTGMGFREVGLYRRHARLDGVWRDIIIVELLIGEAREERNSPAPLYPDP